MEPEYHYATDAAMPAQTRAGGPLTKDMPLTAALKDATGNQIATATRAFNTLFQLKDRLLGTQPSPGSVAANSLERAEPYSFADAMRGAQNELSLRLAGLEVLAEELSNRL